MEAKWLEDFISLARTGNFSQSAGERNITQSAFSRRIKSLEQWVGVSLIDRSTYPTTLTPAGLRFHEAALKATTSLESMRDDLRKAQNPGRDVFRVSLQHSLAGNFLAEWLPQIAPNLNSTLVTVKADNLHDCIRELEEGNVDVLVCYWHQDLPVSFNQKRYRSSLLTKDRLIPVSKADRKARPLHHLKSDSSSEIPWLSYSSEAFLGRATALAMQKNPTLVPLRLVFQSALAEALRAGVHAGLGVAWLPLSMVRPDLEAGSLVHASPGAFELPLQVRMFRNGSMKAVRLLKAVT